MDKKQIILNFIKQHKLTVISTVNSSKPESALIEFGETDNLEIIFDTFVTSRKYRNILHNPHVSFVFGGKDNITVQYEGYARELAPAEKDIYQRIYAQKIPEVEKWINRNDIRFFKVTPQWARYLDVSKEPWDMFEVTF
jgi:general stress protein 26